MRLIISVLPVFGDMVVILGGALHQKDIGDRLPSVHVEGDA